MCIEFINHLKICSFLISNVSKVAVTGVAEISPRKRLRKQNFECTNAEKMKV